MMDKLNKMADLSNVNDVLRSLNNTDKLFEKV